MQCLKILFFCHSFEYGKFFLEDILKVSLNPVGSIDHAIENATANFDLFISIMRTVVIYHVIALNGVVHIVI